MDKDGAGGHTLRQVTGDKNLHRGDYAYGR
jgi:hypothetical protein